jgi:hypothetical protein
VFRRKPEHTGTRHWLLLKTPLQFPLYALIKAGFHDNPMVLDICSIIETRALQDLKWRARVQMPGGVFLIGGIQSNRRMKLVRETIADPFLPQVSRTRAGR